MKNAFVLDRQLTGSNVETQASAARRSIENLLSPLGDLAKDSPNLITNRHARFEVGGERYELPRYLFIGPGAGDAPLRIGIFAGIHGDEPESAHAAVRFLHFLENYAEAAAGYCLYVYPLCNPTGFEDNTRHSRRGKDLNREFWKNSQEPEVRLLQSELASHAFHGIISLHVDDTCDGFYGIVEGATLTQHLVEPALEASEAFLPLDHRAQIDGFPARKSIVRNGFSGVLSAPPLSGTRPFEIVLEAPTRRSPFLTEWAFVAALQSILTNYRRFIAYGRNI